MTKPTSPLSDALDVLTTQNMRDILAFLSGYDREALAIAYRYTMGAEYIDGLEGLLGNA
jgi:hypothetical protein